MTERENEGRSLELKGRSSKRSRFLMNLELTPVKSYSHMDRPSTSGKEWAGIDEGKKDSIIHGVSDL